MTCRFPKRGTTSIILFFLLSGCVRPISPSATMLATRNPTVTSTPTTARPRITVSPTVVPSIVLSSTPTMTPTPSSTPSTAPSPTATLEPAVAPPGGLLFETETGLWLVDGDGESRFLLSVPENDWFSISPDGSRALFGRAMLIVDITSGQEFQLDFSDEYAMCCPIWWPERPNVVLVDVWPGEHMGMGYWSIPAAVFMDKAELRVLGAEPTSRGHSSVSSSGDILAFDQAGAPWLYWWDQGACPFETRDYGFPELADPIISHPAWSPDGSQLAWMVAGILDGDWQHGVGLFDMENRTSRFLYPLEVEGFDGGRSLVYWTPDQKHLALWNHGRDLLWIMAIDGTVKFYGPSHSLHEVRTFPWNSAGQWLVYTVWDRELGRPNVFVTSFDGTETHQVGSGHNVAWSPDGQWMVLGNSHWRIPGDKWLIRVGTWERRRLDLPEEASIVDWIALETAEQ